MMWSAASLLLLLVLPLWTSAFSPEKHHLMGWVRQDHHPLVGDEVVKFSLLLKQRNLDKLDDLFWKVSDPNSILYGQYLSQEQISEIVSPSQHSIEGVVAWLVEHHVRPHDIDIVANKDVVLARAPANVVEKLFDVKLHSFRHPHSERTIIRADKMYTLPSHLTTDIDFVLGVSNFHKVSNRNRAYSLPAPEMPLAGEPQIGRVRGKDHKFTVSFTPTCLSTNVTTTIPPCQDHPPALTQVLVTAISVSDAVNATYSRKGVPECAKGDDGGIECTFTIEAENYNLFNVSIQAFFGSVASKVVVYPYPIMASPMLTPKSIKEYYNIPVGQRVSHPSVTQSVGEFEQQYYDDADLLLFFQQTGLPTNTTVTVVGPNDQSNPGIEANLDIQYIMGIGVGAPTWFWSIYANSTIEIDDILTWALQMSNTPNPPVVNSLSYGMTENAVDLFLGPGYLNRSDVEFKKLALRGITIIIADGDAGAGDLGPPPMSSNTCKPLNADWPSQSPYVTAVSATMFTPLDEPICYLPLSQGGIDCSDGPLGEVPTGVEYGTAWTTGGGFSNTSSQPEYQAAFVKQYLATLAKIGQLPPSGYFNPFGRAYPDVSMVGHNLMVAQSGVFIPVDGTSASAPVFAGFVSLLNSVRREVGRPLLGFLNPILYDIAYRYPAAYNDVIVGNNRCGDVGFTPTCCPYGFQATPGFDAVSGLGSPNFEVFKDVILRY